MSKYYLAVDIGASSGRHILCHVEDGLLITEEIHRFPNGAKRDENNILCWDVDGLFEEILSGMKKCTDRGIIPESVGIDTWGVDFVLVDKNGERIGKAVSYRDSRTDSIALNISDSELYSRTGIQKQKFNTIYQLAYLAKNKPEQLQKADKMLMLPDYFNFLLTGNAMQEYTNATTSNLVNAVKCNWDLELIEKLGLPKNIFMPISNPSTVVGNLKPEIIKKVGFDTKVVMTASHDTASAVMAIPSESNDVIYISSGTWSLMGIERSAPDCHEESRAANFTNEGGFEKRFRYLKNIMGLWMIQQVRHELSDKYSFAELCAMADQSEIDTLVDCTNEAFLAPDSMMRAIAKYCSNNGLQVPVLPEDFARVIYRSLAACYKNTAEEIEKLAGKKFNAIHIIGGGSNADFLCRLTAKFTGKAVCAGPSEATSYGNLAAQLISDGQYKSLSEARSAIKNSCSVKLY